MYLPHAVRQMPRPDRMISISDFRKAVELGELVEDYSEDAPGHRCLILGHGIDRTPIHAVCAPKADYLAIITAYIPSSQEWESDLKERKRP